MKSPGVAALSDVEIDANEEEDAIDRDDVGRATLMSTDLGRDLLLDLVELSGFSALVGELSSRFDIVKIRLRGRDLERSLLPSFASRSSLLGCSVSFFLGLLALGRMSVVGTDVADDSLPLRSPLINAAFSSGFRLRIVSRIL